MAEYLTRRRGFNSRHSEVEGLRGLLVLLVWVVLAGTRPAAAQTPPASPIRSSQDVIVTATAIPVTADWNGRTVIVLTGAEIAALGIRSLSDALRLAPGVDVRARGPLDVQTDFSVRGATFGQNLVLVDGRRLNDSQSGHHNGDIPATLVGIDRIEIVTGPGSAVHGADAIGGTINFVTKQSPHIGTSATVGQHGFVGTQFSAQGGRLPDTVGLAAWGSRSSGFETGREFSQGGASVRAALGRGWTADARHVNRNFGAKNFYGPSPSKEWTDQTLTGANWIGTRGRWASSVRAFARNHGDHFRWDVKRPGFAENRHRTNAVEGTARLQREFASGAAFTFGGGGGGDWVRSTNLGDREYGRGFAFAEVQAPVLDKALLTAGLRADGYSSFGSALSPSVSGLIQIGPSIRLRASAARAFRVPTFTELYYRDPANQGSPDLTSEHGWSLDGGIEWSARGWTASVTPFARWDANVIDWVRATPAEIWRTTNVRDVRSRGVEASLTRRWAGASLRGHLSALDVDAPAHGLLSKYVLEFARHSAGLSFSLPVGGRIRLAGSFDHKHRADGQNYTLVAAKVAYAIRRAEIFIDGTNLLDRTYREIAGVSMPGRWIMVGFGIRH